jgi:hypothetical protein
MVNRHVLRFASIPLHPPQFANLVKSSFHSFEKKPTFTKQSTNAISFSKRGKYSMKVNSNIYQLKLNRRANWSRHST